MSEIYITCMIGSSEVGYRYSNSGLVVENCLPGRTRRLRPSRLSSNRWNRPSSPMVCILRVPVTLVSSSDRHLSGQIYCPHTFGWVHELDQPGEISMAHGSSLMPGDSYRPGLDVGGLQLMAMCSTRRPWGTPYTVDLNERTV